MSVYLMHHASPRTDYWADDTLWD